MADDLLSAAARATLAVRATALALTGRGVSPVLTSAVMMNIATVMAVAVDGEAAVANGLRMLAAKVEAGSYSIPESEADAAATEPVEAGSA